MFNHRRHTHLIHGLRERHRVACPPVHAVGRPAANDCRHCLSGHRRPPLHASNLHRPSPSMGLRGATGRGKQHPAGCCLGTGGPSSWEPEPRRNHVGGWGCTSPPELSTLSPGRGGRHRLCLRDQMGWASGAGGMQEHSTCGGRGQGGNPQPLHPPPRGSGGGTQACLGGGLQGRMRAVEMGIPGASTPGHRV